MTANLSHEIKQRLIEKLKDKSAKKQALKKLIVQVGCSHKGIIRLLEKNIVIRCMKEDKDLITGMLDECKAEFNEFLKKEMNREFNVNLEVSDAFLEKGEAE